MSRAKGRRAAPAERSFLLPACVAVAAAYASVFLARAAYAGSVDLAAAAPLGVFLGLALAAHGALWALGFRGDRVMFAAAFFLSGLGVVAQVRLGTLSLADPARWSNYALPLGVGAMLTVLAAFRGGRVRALGAAAVPCALATLAVLAAMLALGQRFRGAVFLAGNLNPTEIVKVFQIIFAAGLIDAYRKDLENPILPGVPPLRPSLVASFLFFWVAPSILLLGLRDVGMAALLNGAFLLLLVLSTGRWSYLVSTGFAGAAAGFLVLELLPHGGSRVAVWLDPFADPTGKGWQVLQALSAMSTGGLWGAGLGAGHPNAIPIAASDFVYAALAEEIGFVGCGLVIAVYLVLFYRGFRVADSLREPFSRALASGLVLVLALQTVMNIGGVTKALPLTGITLPFVSHGGSSLVTSWLIMGLLMALSEGEKRSTT